MGATFGRERRDAAKARLAALTGRSADSQAMHWSAPHVATFIELIGLREYKHVFLENGVDGPTLLELRRDQFERCLGVSNPLHELSLRYALLDLTQQQIDYTQWEWNCAGVVQWLGARGLEALMPRFSNAAVHGGVLFRLRKVEFASRLFVGEHGESELVLESLWYSIQHAKKFGYFVDSREYPNWGPHEIRVWLEGIHLGHLNPVFREHCVNGTLLAYLDESALRRTMKLTEVQTIVITKAIQRLSAQSGGGGGAFDSATGSVRNLLTLSDKTPRKKSKKKLANQENDDPGLQVTYSRGAMPKGGYGREVTDLALTDRSNVQ